MAVFIVLRAFWQAVVVVVLKAAVSMVGMALVAVAVALVVVVAGSGMASRRNMSCNGAGRSWKGDSIPCRCFASITGISAISNAAATAVTAAGQRIVETGFQVLNLSP